MGRAHDASTGRRLVEAAGLVIERATVEEADEDGEPVPFLWIVARRPGGRARAATRPDP